ncbi:uncharacterized protein [Argopecten irradians]|uniref:uncharacterized protein n=2 Tax=Argopecten irradians TaxID=31199 RepID=UPI003712921D
MTLFDIPNGISTSVSPEEARAEMAEAMNVPEIENFVRSENQHVPTPQQRFKEYSEEDLKALEESRQSKSTKNNTKWGMKLFQDWNMEVYGQEVPMATINEGDLCQKLRQFYAEATPKTRNSGSGPTEYHKNTLINVRAAINRHLHDLGRTEIDIVRSITFKSANNMLDAKLKHNVRSGLSRPTQHKSIISKQDFELINTYLNSGDNPVLLRYRVWVDLAIHFVSRGLEFHIQLTPNSFQFLNDENEHTYVSISHETTQKNKQGGLNSTEAPCSDKRMYATDSETCPVKALRKFLSKTPPNAPYVFNNCNKTAMVSPTTSPFWYTDKPLKQYQFGRFMGDISRNAKCTQHYTAHCLRATAIQAMSDAGFELRHIMFMSGHKNESSVRSYSRGCTTGQKHKLSTVLSAVVQPNSDPKSNTSCRDDELVMAAPASLNPGTHVQMVPQQNTRVASSNNFMSSGLLTNSVFTNCVFNFGQQPNNM